MTTAPCDHWWGPGRRRTVGGAEIGDPAAATCYVQEQTCERCGCVRTLIVSYETFEGYLAGTKKGS